MASYDVSPEQAQADAHQPMNLSNDEATRDYVNVVCRDTDLLIISHKVKSSTRDVYVCLDLEESKIREIEEESCDQSTKVYNAFMAWSEKAANGTWGHLTHCLSTLNDRELLEGVREYLIESRPREGRDCLHNQLMVFHTPQEESESGARGPTQIVLQPCNGIADEPHRYVKQRVRELQETFNDLLAAAEQAMVSHSVPIGQLQVRLTSLCVDLEDNIPLFDKHMLEVIAKTTIGGVIALMTRMKVWDILNFRVLSFILKKCVPLEHEIHGHVGVYSTESTQFKKETLLRDYMSIQGARYSIPHGCMTITAKFNAKYNSYTLADLANDEVFLADEFLLHKFVFRFKESYRGCISIMWFLPNSAKPLLEPPIINSKREALKKRRIVELIVDDKYIYRFPKPIEPPRPLCLSVSHHTSDYLSMYNESITQPDKFWGAAAKQFLEWDKTFTKVSECRKEEGLVQWFTGGQLNVTKNCLDRHVQNNPERTALIWEKNRREGEREGTHEHISYRRLLEMTCRVANVLKTQCEVKKGDTVVIHMPSSPLAVAAMLACARIGAVHCVLYTALTASDLKHRITASNARIVITATQAVVGDKTLEMKKSVDEALAALEGDGANCVQHVLVAVQEGSVTDGFTTGKDIDLEKAMEEVANCCEPVVMESEDPLFIMYTSGTTGEPTGIVHTQAGYLLYAAMTHKYVFDYQEGEVFACVAVLGWITGHTYVVYGPLCNGATSVLFEGTATYPDPGRYWEMVQRLKVNHFYTSPSAIRKLMKASNTFVEDYELSTLKTIGSVGEPLPTAAWKWYYEKVGKEKCILVDTYWQTELGGVVLSPQPGPANGKLKPGACMRPFFGVEPVITNSKGRILDDRGVQGLLCLKNPIPGMGRSIVGKRNFKDGYFNYFPKYPGLYFTHDWAYRDIDGDYQIVGRQDDIIRIKGVWIQVPEIESCIAGGSDKIQNVSLLCLHKNVEEDTSADDATCAVVELKQSVTGAQKSVAFYVEILGCVKEAIIHFIGISGLPRYVLLVRKQIQTWSEKISRPSMREHVKSFLTKLSCTELTESSHQSMVALLDLCDLDLPYADPMWQAVSSNQIINC